MIVLLYKNGQLLLPTQKKRTQKSVRFFWVNGFQSVGIQIEIR